MHIIIGVITAIAGLVWALNSLQNAGVNLNAFNPFFWMRRRRWEKKLGTKPMHALTDSMDVAALLVVAVAKEHGDITRESKLEILSMFEREFGVKRNKAIEMYSSSIYLMQDALNISEEVRHIMKPSKENFTSNHISKLIKMLNEAAGLEEMTDGQRAIIKSVEMEFQSNKDQGRE
ncbi:hypothetical protein [Microbulbifer spongiae]|uniref:Co-chaperone DjlA N-terminal domain-containing protein n=1 Tax=Microbulbifer spongiae TaxID=2944933 RepID=A0ABY9EF87_9GAMM|nr:hypothetical protein [Microbulbifer sp. MI-G]WKD51683.1 hypothetical protein M8T91_18685 [Microbulbifer sp. MI-G]